MITDSLLLDARSFHRLSGWEVKPQGLCRDERCVPITHRADGLVDVADFARRLDMPLVHDDDYAIWAVGPEGGSGKFLDSAVCPDIVLPDLNGEPFAVSSLRGQKVLLLAWASW